MKKQLKKEWKNKSGIYCIKCIITDKVYVGKSINLYERFKSHTTALNRKSKDENSYLIRAWHKYGSENFEYLVLEYCSKDKLKEKELYWIDKLNSLDKSKGYNLRRDTSGGMIPSDETRLKLSKAQINRFKKQSERNKLGKKSKEFWKNNPDVKLEMAKKVSQSKLKFDFLKYDKEGNLLKTYVTIKEIIEENPTYKWQNIYSVCNGYKKTYMGHVWKKQLKR